MAGTEKYSLEKIQIDGKIYRLVVSTDGDNVRVIYNGKAMSVAEALAEIGRTIMSLKNNSSSADHKHTIEAITGLEDALRQIPTPMTAAELQNILNRGK